MKKSMFVLVATLIYTSLTAQWLVHSVPTNKWLNDITFSGNSLFAAGYSGTILKSTNGGLNWTALNPPTSYNIQTVLFKDASTGFATASTSTYNSILLKTTNGGTNWTVKFSKGTFMFLKGLCFINSNTGYAGGWGFSDTVMFRTTDGGENWNAVRISGIYGVDRIYFLNSSTGWAVGGNNDSSSVLKTTDGGYNWTKVFTQAGNPFLYLYAVQFVNQYTGWAIGLKPQSVIIKTTDGGATWTNQYHNHTTNWELYDINMINENTGWIAGDGGVIVKTTNGGINWRAQVNPYSGNPVFAIRFSGSDTGYAVCSNGRVLKTLNGGGPVEVRNITSEIPSSFSLSQNYPNPFNPETKIVYSIKKVSDVTLDVFDATGKEISTIVNERQSPGTYEAVFNASSLSSGVYYYRLTAENFSETKKMVVIK